MEITKQPLGVDKWIAQLEKGGRHIKYSSSEARYKLTEVARKTVYGHFSPALKQNVSERYSDLLTSISQRNEFNKIYQTLKSEREKLPISGTYIWTSKVGNVGASMNKIDEMQDKVPGEFEKVVDRRLAEVRK
ncbi:hypothetical protein BGP78_01545 [Pseudoalteromonas sp. MSK9-3]|uniref:hypothetical protein n=1 Tax=Pseudoalteromonas sp. MSK9-3 TaxID=1897633 RepID=UPI000E6B80F8|nr:hypothetical protein [Pseudoalteromonas sp. MSK9-3]RJE76958.1 hypothetical protein BGP78_01545 [Pseudoalteromonas sp. MSK9-3]